MTTVETSVDTTEGKDEILQMFFDEEFVPQAFVDILLTDQSNDDLHSLQTISTNLLTKLDFYTRNLTIELENTIYNLEKLSETLPGTYSKYNTDNNYKITDSQNPISSKKVMGISKLEYYIDTLGSSVKSLESDLNKVELDITNLEKKNNNNNNNSKDFNEKILTKLNNLKIIKQRLNNVLSIFKELQKIISIPVNTSTDDGTNFANSKKEIIQNDQINIDSFDISLQTLQDLIEQSLDKLISNESNNLEEQDIILDESEIFNRINQFTKLSPVFHNLKPFDESFTIFIENIHEMKNDYLFEKENKSKIDKKNDGRIGK